MHPQLDALARVTLTDRDEAARRIASRTLHPSDVRRLEGQVEAYNLTLASIAGMTGWTDRAGLELYLTSSAPAVQPTSAAAGPDDDEDDDEPAARSVDRRLDMTRLTGTDAQAIDAAIHNATADPMGGWEPRS